MITEKQQQLLQFIYEFMRDKKYCPSYREIGDHLGTRCQSQVWKKVSLLKERGLIENRKNESRSLSITKEGRKWIK